MERQYGSVITGRGGPVRPNAVKKLNGELTEGQLEVSQRWKEYFNVHTLC